MSFLYLDSNSLNYAFRAGGVQLLDKISSGAQQAGYTLKITDAVAGEIALGPLRVEIVSWLSSKQISGKYTQAYTEFNGGAARASSMIPACHWCAIPSRRGWRRSCASQPRPASRSPIATACAQQRRLEKDRCATA
jgi:hypothetical protein